MKVFLKNIGGISIYEEVAGNNQVKITAERNNFRRILVVYYKHKRNAGQEEMFRHLAYNYLNEIRNEFAVN